MRDENIIGHEDVRRYFKEAIESNILSHAHLIIGEDGIGKSLLAKEFASSILGKNQIKQYVDVLEFRNKKGKKSIGVDEIRSIIEEISKKPFEGNKKVIIIYEGDRITIQAQNAFLKTMEEPPKGVYIFILSENLELILETIKSRCQIHKLSKLSIKDIKIYLGDKYPKLPQKEFETILSFCEGVPGKADKFIENESFRDIRNITIKLLIDINGMNESGIFTYEECLTKYKDRYEEILMVLLSYIRDIMLYKEVGKEDLIVNKDKLIEIKEAANLFSFNKLNGIIEILNYTRDNFKSNVNAALAYDVMLLKMLEA